MITKKTLTHQEYLTALGLFTLAQNHYRLVREFEVALDELVGETDPGGGSIAADEFLDPNGSLDAALKKAGISVKPRKK